MLVGENLSFNVPWMIEITLDEALPATECGDSFADGGVVKLGNLFKCARHLEAPTTTTECRLDGDRKAMG